jgi:hypothetical protein
MTKARKPGAGAVPRFFYTIDGVSYSVRTYCEARGLTDKLSVTRVGSIMSNYRGSPAYETNLAAELLKQEVTRAIRRLKDKNQETKERKLVQAYIDKQQTTNREAVQAVIDKHPPTDSQQLIQRFALDILHTLKPQLRAPMESYAAILEKQSALSAEFTKTKKYLLELESKHAQGKSYLGELQDKYAKNREEKEELEMLLRNVDKQDS